jgi:putative DNA primase/helicase
MSSDTEQSYPNFPKVRSNNIPDVLKTLDRWVIWRAGPFKHTGKFDKVPCDPRTGRNISAQDPGNWLSFADALAAYDRGAGDGLGIALSSNHPIVVDGINYFLTALDFDGVGTSLNEVKELWLRLGKPYAEVSPSQNGLRMFALSTIAFKGGNAGNGHEFYTGGRFMTVTGWSGRGKIKDTTEGLGELHEQWFPRDSAKQKADLLPAMGPLLWDETKERYERLNDLLSHISSDTDYASWRDIVWSILSTGLTRAETIARDWSMQAKDRYEEEAFQTLVASFDPIRGITPGTLYYHAKLNGWVRPIEPQREVQASSARLNGSLNLEGLKSQGDLDPPSLGVDKFTSLGGDEYNGKRLASLIRGKLLYIHETGDWLEFAEKSGWTHAAPGAAVRAAKELLKQLRTEAAEAYKAAPDDNLTKALMSHVKRSSQAQQIKAMIEMAKSEPGMTVRLSEFDNDPMLLGVANGVLDLRTAQLLPTSPNILVSKRCKVAYDGDAQCPRFEQFMAEIQPDEEVREFLQRWIGYGLTGLTSEQKFAFFYGSGANGKSVFIEVIAWLLGDYAIRMATEVLMSYKRNPQAASPEIVALKGARYAYANETVEGRHLDDARVKEMTGGDTLTGRVPYGKAAISFQPTHKLSIAGNHKPEISDASNGMWRRVMLVPFEQTIAADKRDPNLLDKLKSEGSGILNWALQGLLAFQKNGLQVPQSIARATEAYRDEQDILGEWISGSCNTGATLSASKVKLYESYRAWCEENGNMPLSQGRLTKRLNERGYRLAPDKRTVNGLALKPPDQRAAWK